MEMDEFNVIGDNEIRIIGEGPEQNRRELPEKPKWKRWVAIGSILAILLLGGLFFIQKDSSLEKQPLPPHITGRWSTNNVTSSYVVISDTILNNVSLHCFMPINARPKLEVGLIKEIPSNFILGAMAADFGKIRDSYQVVGGFVHQGEMFSHSKSKYGFCALLKDTVVIGNDLSTSYFEQAIEEKGDFFRQHALVHEGKVVNKVIAQDEALRRSLCRLGDGHLCVIDTDMSVSLDIFAEALRQYGVIEAIALMGSGAAVRWAVDKAGRRYIAGADEYDFPDVVNYIVWEKDSI